MIIRDRVLALEEGRITAHGVPIPALGLPRVGQGARKLEVRQAKPRQIDVKRCLAGVRAAGLQPEEVVITKCGEIRIRIGSAMGVADAAEAEIERHFAPR